MAIENATEGSVMPSRRRKFTPVVIEEIPRLVGEGRSPTEIADLIGCTVSTLRVRCSQLRISLRRDRTHQRRRPQTARRRERSQLTVVISRGTVDALREHAMAEGLSEAQLASALLEAIVRDGLYKAVLDRD
jgi:hypothetical protein